MKLKEPEMIYKGGKPTAVILPLAQYEELLERVEDAADLKYLRKLRREGASFRPFADYLKEKKRRVPGRR
jgi:PHD/YefM family antitoxin component YafN of YafNO toxin-antitoxin module